MGISGKPSTGEGKEFPRVLEADFSIFGTNPAMGLTQAHGFLFMEERR
jgi:hypothetical protein